MDESDSKFPGAHDELKDVLSFRPIPATRRSLIGHQQVHPFGAPFKHYGLCSYLLSTRAQASLHPV